MNIKGTVVTVAALVAVGTLAGTLVANAADPGPVIPGDIPALSAPDVSASDPTPSVGVVTVVEASPSSTVPADGPGATPGTPGTAPMPMITLAPAPIPVGQDPNVAVPPVVIPAPPAPVEAPPAPPAPEPWTD